MRHLDMLAILPCALALHLSGCGGGESRSAAKPENAPSPPVPTEVVPAQSLVGTSWQAKTIRASAVIEGTRVFLTIAQGGLVSGSTGCNNFTGGVTIKDDTIAFGPAASTRRACEPAIMDQEQRFLQALGAAARFQRAADGALVLTSASGETLLHLVPTSEAGP